ncbi:MAG TPA: protein kinase [Coleofasciculaceae cyanobacterium]
MTSLHCSRGHSNTLGSRFCHLCGEKLAGEGLAAAAGIYPGLILGDRYSITCELGHGGFGRTYLAEDINRFNEACVLKEFAPQVQGTYALQKSEELFEREAGVLYKLRHPQIPQFRELFRANLGDRGYLFLVQDFVEGQTYRQLLETRRQKGFLFSELEIRQLLAQLLPVLHYIHANGVIHRDISPDNLILRSTDHLPVLIDFGGVKQVAAAAASQFMTPEQLPPVATRLGKVGYAPDEQMQSGLVSPPSDLYALAMTAMVLMTGKEPLELVSGQTFQTWQQQLDLSSNLATVLLKMLSPQPAARFQSALEVLHALQLVADAAADLALTQPPAVSYPVVPALTQPPTQPTETLSPGALSPGALSPGALSSSAAYPAIASPPRAAKERGMGILLLLVALAGMAGGGWWLRDRWLPSVGTIIPQPQNSFSAAEQQRKQALQTRRQTLGISPEFLISLTNATFYERHPDQQGRKLSDDPVDTEWRSIWDGIANEWLTLLAQNLSAEARQKLGNYTSADRDQWKQEVNKLYVGSRSLFDVTDAKFFHLLPQMQGKEFIDQPIGQVWQAIAADQVRAMQAGKILSQLQFAPDSFSTQDTGNLAPGEGRVYTAKLSQGQIMRVSLQAPAHSTLFSIYLPRPGNGTSPFPEDSADVTWAGQLSQSGYYEFVVVDHSSSPISYQLNVAVDNITSTPAQAPTPEAPEAKN